VLSAGDRDRLKVLHEAEGGHLKQPQAGAPQKLSARRPRRLLGGLWEKTTYAQLRRRRIALAGFAAATRSGYCANSTWKVHFW
jgi:hypothetical protein